jgi:hypothetical protein
MVASPSPTPQPGHRRRARITTDFDAACPRCGAGLSPRLLESADDHLTCLFCGSTVAPPRPDAGEQPRRRRSPVPDNVTLLGPQGDLDRRSRVRPRPLLLITLSIVAIVAVAALGRSGPSSPTPAELAANEPPARTAPMVEPEEPTRVAPSPEVAAPVNRITLSITAVDLCWVRLSIDGEERVARTLEPGERVTFRAKDEADLRLGNAAGARVQANGRAVRTGGSGEVVDLRLSLVDGRVAVDRSS